MLHGTVFSPFCFPVCTSPLLKIVEKHKYGIHMYIDDIQLYMACTAENGKAASKMEDLAAEGKKWIPYNFLNPSH